MRDFQLFVLSTGFGILGLAAQHATAAPSYCGPRDNVAAQLEAQYGETRQSVGLSQEDHLLEVFASLETGSWTITITTPDGVSCLVAAGQAYQYLGDPLSALGRDV